MLLEDQLLEPKTENQPQTALPIEMSAGGGDPSRFDCTEAWYPVYYLEDLDPAQPNKFTLLGQDLVIWWDQAGKSWRAMADQCPHRLAPLSEGRIAEDGLLECPYHGWAFNGDGTCDRIPQQSPEAAAHTSKRACVQSLPTAERQGLLFVYPGNPDHAPQVKIPITAPLEESPNGWTLLNTFRDIPYDALTLLENVLDVSHVPFTHHRSVSNRSSAAPIDLELVTSGKQGFTGTWAEGPRKGTLGRQDTTFIAPSLMWHDLTSKQFGRTLTVVYATPMRKGECRLFARFPFQFSSKIPALFIQLTPRWYSHLQQNNILEDDQIFLHYQERYLEAKVAENSAEERADLSKAFYLPTRGDAYVSALRNWVKDFAADPFPGVALPPARSDDALLDRYSSHTRHCADCQSALATLQKLRLGLAIAAALIWSLFPLLAFTVAPSLLLVLALTLIPLLAGGLWLWLGRLETKFSKGRRIAPRNL
jgi:phenylpropionate dioxygenase-like ring-hydroxylating dioxygenase large terminal subunit